MKGENLFNTIVAISTPPGKGGISLIRVSGEKAIEISNKILSPKIHQKTELRKAILRNIHTIDNNIIDKGLVTAFKSPKSYTGEDMVEISCHGGLAIPNIIIEELLKAGARQALNGEFSKRAYLNNKIDLIQAEAIEEIISAKTKDAVFLAQSNIEKRFSNIIQKLKMSIIDVLSIIEVNIDYPEEDLDNVDYVKIKNEISYIKNEINRLISETRKGRAVINGVKIALVGKTNVGKSSLMNCLLREDRAIVSDIHGTTRDYLEGTIDVKGIPITLIDTAGIRKTSNIIEELGTTKSKDIIKNSDLILFIIDAESGINHEDKIIYDMLKNKNVIFIINKIDLVNWTGDNEINDFIHDFKNNYIDISVKKEINIHKLEDMLYKKVINIESSITQKEILVNNRHKNCLLKVIKNLEDTEKSIDDNISYEFIALDIRKALDNIAEITGEISNDDVMDNIFNRFCVGK
jgi:tRNA modification GTPase